MTISYPEEMVWDDLLDNFDLQDFCAWERWLKECEQQDEDMKITEDLERYSGLL